MGSGRSLSLYLTSFHEQQDQFFESSVRPHVMTARQTSKSLFNSNLHRVPLAPCEKHDKDKGAVKIVA